jgi:hypothetical protein
MKNIFHLILIFLISIHFVDGQHNIGVELGGRVGVLVPHRPVMKHLPSENIEGFDFSVFKIVSGDKYWHKIYNSPKIGLTFYHSNLGNKEILGNTTGLTSWMDFPFVNNQHHRFGINLRLGLTHVSTPFDLITNPTNIPISSHWNCLAIGGIQYQYKWDKFSLGSRIELTHLSNAALEAPNLGLNMYQASISLGYNFSKNKLQIELLKNHLEKKDEINHSKNYLYFIGFISRKQLFNHLGENFNVKGGTVSYQHLFSLPLGVEIGFDLMQNDSDIKLLADKELIVDKVIKTGAYLGYVLTLNKLHFVVGMGHYLYDTFNLNDKLYHRVGLRYTFLNRFVLNTTLKSHWGNADYLELGLGMRFG